ncbi:MAG: hypothetical protein GX678_07845 [Actinomycetales bacterium]|nr:hypothetical protein [Actinomycetales bacterium]
MKPFYRLIMRGNSCVGVAVGVNGEITLVTELSGRADAIESFMAEIPKASENADEWFYALNDLLPMTYKIGNVKKFDGADPNGNDSNEAAQNLASEKIVIDSRSSRLTTTRTVVTAAIGETEAPVAEESNTGKLRGREEEDAELAAAAAAAAVEVEEPAVDVAEEVVEAIVEEPAAPQEPSPEIVVVEANSGREPFSIADDGAGLHEQWYLLLEDWNGLAAIFAGDRARYSVLARSATQIMSEQISEAVPSQAANLEHWVTMLIRELPAGVWLRSFASVRSVSEATHEEPVDVLRAAISFYGTPSAVREYEVFGNGDIDGSLVVDTTSGQFALAEAEVQAEPAEETADV